MSKIQSLRLSGNLHFIQFSHFPHGKSNSPRLLLLNRYAYFFIFRIESIHGMIDTMSQCVLDGVSGMNLRRLDKLDIFP